MLPYMGLIQNYQTTCQPVNQAICSYFILGAVESCNLVSIENIIIIIILIAGIQGHR